MIFFCASACGAAAFAIIRRNYEDVAEARPAPLDVPGMALYLPALLTLILGVSLQPSLGGAGLLAMAASLVWGLYRAESGRERPLLDIAYLRGNRRFTLANLTSTLGYGAGFSTGFLASLYLQGVAGLTASRAGYVLLAQPLVLGLFSPLAGILSDRFRPARVASAGLLILGAGMFAFSMIGPNASVLRVATLLALAGVGFALFVSPNIHAIMRSTDATRMGMASGLLATMRGMGMCLSLSAAGIVLALYTGAARDAGTFGPEILPALRTCFAFSGLVALVAACVSWKAAHNTSNQ